MSLMQKHMIWNDPEQLRNMDLSFFAIPISIFINVFAMCAKTLITK